MGNLEFNEDCKGLLILSNVSGQTPPDSDRPIRHPANEDSSGQQDNQVFLSCLLEQALLDLVKPQWLAFLQVLLPDCLTGTKTRHEYCQAPTCLFHVEMASSAELVYGAARSRSTECWNSSSRARA